MLNLQTREVMQLAQGDLVGTRTRFQVSWFQVCLSPSQPCVRQCLISGIRNLLNLSLMKEDFLGGFSGVLENPMLWGYWGSRKWGSHSHHLLCLWNSPSLPSRCLFILPSAQIFISFAQSLSLRGALGDCNSSSYSNDFTGSGANNWQT